jgi:hypothetical protein
VTICFPLLIGPKAAAGANPGLRSGTAAAFTAGVNRRFAIVGSVASRAVSCRLHNRVPRS